MNNPNELKSEGKKFVNELVNPEIALQETTKQNNLKKPKGGIVEKHNSGPLLTNDGRVVLSEETKKES